MKSLKNLAILATATLGIGLASSATADVFTYQGKLSDLGIEADGVYDFEFRMYTLSAGGALVGSDSAPNVTVTDGLFNVDLDFGAGTFSGAVARWIEIDVRPDGAGAFETLAPRQQVNPAPRAHYAASAGSAATLPAVYPNAINFTNPGNQFAGNGSGLTKLNASELLTGNVPIARMATGGNWNLTSDLNIDNNSLVVDISTNRVGIGTATPAADLHINGGAIPTFRFEGTSNPLMTFVEGGVQQAFIQKFGTDFYVANQQAGSMILRTSNINRVLIDSDGDVGIGTSTPGARLNVESTSFNTGAGGGYAHFGPSTGSHVSIDNNEVQTYTNATTPGGTLFLQFFGGDTWLNTGGGSTVIDGVGLNMNTGADMTFDSDTDSIIFPATVAPNDPMISMFASGTTNAPRMALGHSPAFPTYGLQYTDTSDTWEFVSNGVETVQINPNFGGYLELRDSTGDPTILINGNVGGESRIEMISQTSGTRGVFIDIDGNDNGRIILEEGNAGTGANMVTIETESTGTAAGGQILLGADNGTTTIQLDANWAGSGEGRIVTDELQITGGADLSEQFDIGTPEGVSVEPGMVVSIDATNFGELVVSGKAYDRTVAGIISGAGGVKPGMLMGQRGTEGADGQLPVALTGRVYVWCDASSGSIQPGDLLTTSATPGHAMKVTDYTQAQGSIIGKAMGQLDEGTGLVLVLVSLQ